MKMLLLTLFTISSAFAELDDAVLIRGKIGSTFDDTQVKVHDSLGQTYFLPKKVFPESFPFSEGKSFALEVDHKVMASVTPIKNKK